MSKKPTQEELEKRIKELEKELLNKNKKIEELNNLVLKDELTGLYSKTGFISMAEKELEIAYRAEQRVFVFYADLDRFKEINDTYDHATGDQAIKDASEVLKKTFRKSDILARLHGDEFVGFGIEKEALTEK
ncbi:GGDEF domain-containing protein, partial [Candidatus Woesearchaeota archaeon]|nr:GGDEF domain-containing protein [Candidatus Woesearchaeota archaeon]